MAYEQPLVPPHLNPELSPEQEREVEFFRHWGYLLVEQAITPAQVALLREALDEVLARHTKRRAPRCQPARCRHEAFPINP